MSNPHFSPANPGQQHQAAGVGQFPPQQQQQHYAYPQQGFPLPQGYNPQPGAGFGGQQQGAFNPSQQQQQQQQQPARGATGSPYPFPGQQPQPQQQQQYPPQPLNHQQSQQQQQQQQQQQMARPGEPGFSQHPHGPPGFPALPPGVPPHMAAGLSRQRFSELATRLAALKAQGANEQNSPELVSISQVIKMFQKLVEWNKMAVAAKQRQQAASGQQAPQQNPSATPSTSVAPAPTPGAPGATATPAVAGAGAAGGPTYTAEQLAQLRAQMHTFKLLGKNMPVPPHLLGAVMANAGGGGGDVKVEGGGVLGERLGAVLTRKVVEGVADGQHQADGRKFSAGVKELDGVLASASAGQQQQQQQYGSYVHPLTVLAKHAPSNPFSASKHQRLLMPSVLPPGLDPYLVLEERNRFVQTRIEWRIAELEALSAMVGEATGGEPAKGLVPQLDDAAAAAVDGDAKRRALIELKSLRLLERQRTMREGALRALDAAGALTADRAVQKKVKKHAQRDARRTEELERRQRAERERQVKQRQNDYVDGILRHGRELARVNTLAADKARKLGKMVLSYHAATEKEEQKRVERISKERLRALKADDEEAYMALLDTAKDTRITHLLKQTDAFLDSLAQAVVAQQNDDVHRHGATDMAFETEDGPADESMFGAVNMVDEVGGEDGTVGDKGGDKAGGEQEKKVDYYAVAHRISEKVTVQPSILVGGTLKEYQLKGLQWMVSLYNNRLNGILADEMGLGKTIQTLSLITFLIEKKQQRGPFLVIVPLSTITNWTLEFEKWAPAVSTVVFKGTPQARRDAAARIRTGNFQVVITTFEYIIREKALLGKIKWVHMIIDEGHRMKNTQSKLSQTLTQHYTSRYRLILTGTPLQNNLPELWALLNFVLPKVFNSVKSFDEWFNTPFANTGTNDKIDINEEEQLLIIRRLHKVLRPFLLRRLKKDVESELPDKVEKVIKCRMSALQHRVYTTYRKHGFLASADGADPSGGGKTSVVKGLNNTLMQLRKICNHPFVIPDIENAMCPGGPDRLIDDLIWRTSGKFELLDRILPKLFATGHRVLIFFQMVQIMNIFHDYCNYKGWGEQVLKLDGSTAADQRTEMIVKFNHPESPHKLFILSTRAGGLGLNLQTADTVIIYDSDWNPHADLQAQDRAHRIGQKKVVKIFRLITNKSIEEDIYSAAQGKLAIDGKVIQAGKFDNKSSAAEQEALLRSLLEAENEEGDDEDNGEMGDDEINDILARGDHEKPVFEELDRQREDHELAVWTAQGGVGPVPDRLLTDAEVPEFYKREFKPKADIEVMPEEGRGQRVRAEVRYDDGLTEEQFLNAVEDEEGGLEAAMERAARRGRGGGGRSAALTTDDDDDDDDDDDSASDAFGGKPAKRGGARGRAGKGKQHIIDDDDDDDDSSAAGRRKRPRQSRATTMDDTDNESIRDSKRRKTGGQGKSAEMKEALMSVYTALANLGGSTVGLRSTAFLSAVDKKAYPQYYLVIKKPVFMSQIKRRIQNQTYKTVEAFGDDFRQMFQNAYMFNEENSWVWQDARALEAEFEQLWQNFIVGSGLPGAPAGPETPAAVVSTPATDASAEAGPSSTRKLTLKFGKKTAAAPPPPQGDDDDEDGDSASASEDD